MNLDKILKDSEDFINTFTDKSEQRILKAIRQLELNILDMAKELPTAKGSLKYNLKQAQEFHKNLLKEFELTYNVEISGVLKDFYDIEKFVLKELDITGITDKFSVADKEMFIALKTQSEVAFVHLGEATSDKLMQSVYSKVITGGKFSNLVTEFRASLSGVESESGRPLSSYAKTYANDSVNGYYAQIHIKKAKDAGLTDYIYYGNTMKDSRDFCKDNVGKTFTYEEIKELENKTWQGKKPGDIFIVRGGYNCRHQFRAIFKKA